jgi:hypothetical protein
MLTKAASVSSAVAADADETTAAPCEHAETESSSDSSDSDDASSVFSTGAGAGGYDRKALLQLQSTSRNRRLPEIPRIRNRFRDQRVILGDKWRFTTPTLKSKHLEVARRLGLESGDWDVARIYDVNIEDLIIAAEIKHKRLEEEAAVTLQHFVRSRLLAEKEKAEMGRFLNGVRLVQKWWHTHRSYVLPIKSRCKERPAVAQAKARVAGAIMGWWTRKHLQVERDCHHIKIEMKQLQQDLGRSELYEYTRIIIYIQARMRRFVAQRRVAAQRLFMDSLKQELEEKNCSRES